MTTLGFFTSVDNMNDVFLIRSAFRPVRDSSFTLSAVLSMKCGHNNWSIIAEQEQYYYTYFYYEVVPDD